MGFFARRRAAKFTEKRLEALGVTSDGIVELPLHDKTAQELRVAVEERLERQRQMPEFWAQIGFDYTNAREDVEAQRTAGRSRMHSSSATPCMRPNHGGRTGGPFRATSP